MKKWVSGVLASNGGWAAAANRGKTKQLSGRCPCGRVCGACSCTGGLTRIPQPTTVSRAMKRVEILIDTRTLSETRVRRKWGCVSRRCPSF